ncbi:MAG TPA: polysaccharide deacetylase family protein [Acidimicrobiales bacterium]|nr:polysaccharide deacetylase family protein [Acidimicrobiales bacterium]
MGRRGALHVARATVAIGAIALLWPVAPAHASTMRVTVNGKRIQLAMTNATVHDAIEAAGLQLRVGFMRSVATGDPIPHQVREPRILIDNESVPVTRPLGNGDHITVINGRDFVEPVVEQLQPLKPAGLPDVEMQVWQPGSIGTARELVGRYSGQVAGPEQVIKPALPAEPTHRPVVLLSFDDGPDGRWTPQVLDILKAKNVKAVFCLIGIQIQRFPQLVQRIHAEGHTLCDHSMHHDMKASLKPIPYQLAEVDGPFNLIMQLTGTPPRFYRGPGGNTSPSIIAEAHRLGMRVLAWNVDPGDYTRPGAEMIQNRIALSIKNGGVALMHDGGGDRSETVAQLPGLIDRLRAAGYSFTIP